MIKTRRLPVGLRQPVVSDDVRAEVDYVLVVKGEEHAVRHIRRCMPQDGLRAHSATTGKPYSGINVLSLWASAMAQNFAAPIWMTFKQASELDAHIRKGEKGSLVVYADSITRKETDEIDREIPFLKGYTVFNVEQIEGLPEVYYAKAAPTLDPVARIDHAEKYFAALGATIRHGGNRAFYSIAADAIQMPPFESFQDADSYYETLTHECTHWTGSKTRLDRDFGGHRFGSEGYAVEELVAELGAAFLCADLELALEPREDHASYIATWLKVLATDNRAVFTAAAHAQRAAEFINRKATEAAAQVTTTCAA
jgi:antirestriction protein ArdC